MTAPWHFAGYRQRRLIYIPTAHTTATYFAISLTPHDGDFWAEVQSNGYDVRFIHAYAVPGATATTHNRAAWDATAKTATFNVTYTNPFGATTAGHFYWMYYDSETTVSVDPSVAVTTTTPVTSSMYRGAPAGQVVEVIQPSEAVPSQKFTAAVGSQPYLWFRFGDALGAPSWRGANGEMASPLFLSTISFGSPSTDIYSGGAAQSKITQAGCEAMELDDELYVGLQLSGTATAGDYIVKLYALAGMSPGGAIPGDGAVVTLVGTALLTIITPSEA